jgi:glycosyltransferase involved in cell wall biosynthesis
MESVLLEVATHFDVHLFLLGETSPLFIDRLSQSGIKILNIKVIGRSRTFIVMNRQIISFCFKRKPIVIYASGVLSTYSSLLALMTYRKAYSIYTRHHTNSHWNVRRLHWKYLDKLTFRVFKKVIAVSGVVRSALLKEGCDDRKIGVIWNGIRLSEFIKIRKSRSIRNESQAIKVGIISRLEKYKGVVYTLDAILQLNATKLSDNVKFHVMLAGNDTSTSDPKLKRHLALANETSIIQFLPWQVDMTSFYEEIDLLVHVPVDETSEAFGMVYIEALATGVPSVFTVSGVLTDFPELTEFATIVLPKDTTAIKKALLTASALRLENKSPVLVPEEYLKCFDLKSVSRTYLDTFINK